MGMSFGHKDAHDPPYPPEMTAARARIKAACDRAGLAFLDLVREDNVVAQLDAGVRVGAATAEAAQIGRRHTRRPPPWWSGLPWFAACEPDRAGHVYWFPTSCPAISCGRGSGISPLSDSNAKWPSSRHGNPRYVASARRLAAEAESTIFPVTSGYGLKQSRCSRP
jgi:hypothetical protein